MADEPNKSGSWWSTLPGILTATAAVITAATGLVAIVSQTGVFGEKSKTFVSQRVSDVRDAVSAPTPSKADVPPAASQAPVAVKGDAATGIATTPLHAVPFTGAVVTLLNGSVVKLRDDVRDMCQPTPILKTLSGQSIDMQRMRRFELSDWSTNDRHGSAHIVLNNGETMDVKVEGCAIIGTNDLGDYRGPFETIRSVEFIR